jgi:hypothetical protein
MSSRTFTANLAGQAAVATVEGSMRGTPVPQRFDMAFPELRVSKELYSLYIHQEDTRAHGPLKLLRTAAPGPDALSSEAR